MIDPITALAGIQSAVALIKKVSKTVDDVSSLGPVLGKYFDAKNTATKAAVHARTSGNKSAMAVAIEIEMALEQTAQFEKQLQLLFMQTGKIDVWNKIKARAQQMEIEAAHDARKLKELKRKQKRQMQMYTEFAFGFVLVVMIIVGAIWLGANLIEYCLANRCSLN